MKRIALCGLVLAVFGCMSVQTAQATFSWSGWLDGHKKDVDKTLQLTAIMRRHIDQNFYQTYLKNKDTLVRTKTYTRKKVIVSADLARKLYLLFAKYDFVLKTLFNKSTIRDSQTFLKAVNFGKLYYVFNELEKAIQNTIADEYRAKFDGIGQSFKGFYKTLMGK